MKKMFRLISTGILSLLILAPIHNQASAAPKVLKLSSLYTVISPNFVTPEWFAAEFEKRTKGAYKIEIYKGGTLGKVQDLPKLCADGVVDFILSAVSYTPNVFKISRGLDLLYMSENPHACGMAYWDMYHNYPPVRNEWHKNGLVYAFTTSIGNMAVVSKTPINTVAEMKGMKVRTVGVIGKMVEKWGGNPVSLAFPEVYEALNRGLIQGSLAVPIREVHISRLWEVAPYVIDTGVGNYGTVYVAISKKIYDDFPADVRKILDQLREETNVQDRKWHESYLKEIMEKLSKEKSVQLISWSTEEKLKAKNLATPYIWEDWLKEMEGINFQGKELLDVYRNLLKKYESQYPFVIAGYNSPYDYFKSLKKGQ